MVNKICKAVKLLLHQCIRVIFILLKKKKKSYFRLYVVSAMTTGDFGRTKFLVNFVF